MFLFKKLKSYKGYLKKYPLHNLIDVDLKSYGPIHKKINRSAYYSVDPNFHEPYSAELDDLIRLHHLVISRKVTTILEFGVGKSSIIFDHALKINKKLHSYFVKKHLRRTNPFQCFSVDNNKKWISVCKKSAKTDLVRYHYSRCSISTFNDRICTYYDNLPNICPDLIYLDGPDQFSPIGHIRGINTRNADRLPMSADILGIEHFLLPGTLIVVDGRTANARFLKTNLQRDWSYYYSKEYDQHYFELIEKPLGIYNKNQIDYCLGKGFYLRIKK
tara:strand:+ start:2629 stop:3450 length:822 start_codon:yes stop_codon:yes gene_type:complete